MKTRIAITAALVLIGGVGAQKAKTLFKVTKVSLSQVAVSCTNGADPTIRRIGDMLVVACAYAAVSDPVVGQLNASR